MKTYTHLSFEERRLIQKLKKQRFSNRAIARLLERSPSTIGREIKRNSLVGAQAYCADWGQWLRDQKSKYQYIRGRKIHGALESLITILLRCYLSPEQASGYLFLHHGLCISHESIYRYIYASTERKLEFKPFLRQGSKMRRKKYGSGARASTIPNRVSIENRPSVVDQKDRIGDLEADTVIGLDRSTVMVTLVDRKSLFRDS